MNRPGQAGWPGWSTPSRQAARRRLLIYLVAVVVLSTPLEIGIIATDAFARVGSSVAWLSALMLVPTTASVIARVWSREGFADLGFRRGHDVGRALVVAVVVPFLVGALAYGAAWLTGLVGLRVPPPLLWAVLVAANLVLNLVLSTGEELGWRGYVLPRMVEAGVPWPVLVSSLVWGLWHVPLFLWGGFVHDGPDPRVVTGLLLVLTLAAGYVMGRLRLDTGNVWPAVLLHIVWNTAIQTVFDPLTTGEDKALWTGETGILTAVVFVGIALVYRYRRPPRPDNGVDGSSMVHDDLTVGSLISARPARDKTR